MYELIQISKFYTNVVQFLQNYKFYITMNKFEYTKESIAEAVQYLKNNNDYFYKTVTAWDILTKCETISVPNSTILDEANLLYNNLNKI